MNSYLDEIYKLSVDKDKAQEYISLCTNAMSRSRPEEYTEKHHILPKCACALDEQKTDNNNLVVLTAGEHFKAHMLLSEMFSGPLKRKMLFALSGLCTLRNGLRIFTPEEYSAIKEASRAAKRGIPLTEEHKQKIKDSFALHNPNKGRKASESTRKKQSLAKIGKPRIHSPETRKKLSESRIGLIIDDVTCPHCGKTGKPGPLGKWHFNNCKARNNG